VSSLRDAEDGQRENVESITLPEAPKRGFFPAAGDAETEGCVWEARQKQKAEMITDQNLTASKGQLPDSVEGDLQNRGTHSMEMKAIGSTYFRGGEVPAQRKRRYKNEKIIH